jgi:CubicO group peptidase (beta-lactamase class C family)
MLAKCGHDNLRTMSIWPGRVTAQHTLPPFPPPESQGGWRYLTQPEDVRSHAGMDPDALDLLQQEQELLHGGDSWGFAIIRHGYLVRECYTFNVLIPTRFNIWSCTKTFTGTAWGLLLDESRQGKLPSGQRVELDSPAYAYLPEGHPLSDPRKEEITIGHLLSMTSGIPGESRGVRGIPTTTDTGPFEHALGRYPNRYGRRVDTLSAPPGTRWDYSDPAIAHLALIFARITGREIRDYLQERIFAPIGIEGVSWDIQGGSGFLGPHTNAHTGLQLSARDLARFGYLALYHGVWNGATLIPRWWQDLATRSSQDMNPEYGYTWWVNETGSTWPGLPKDAIALSGYRSNRCYVIPSLDLVVARVGSGPPTWSEQGLIGGVVKAILAD